MRKMKAEGEIVVTLIIVVVLLGAFWFFPMYGNWTSAIGVKTAQNNGRAKLAEANQSRQILITNAKAKEEAAVYDAQAEVNRAVGVAKANKIIGQGLKNNDEYLMYLYIQNMHQSKNQIIYIPTEGGLPVLEAGRFKVKH